MKLLPTLALSLAFLTSYSAIADACPCGDSSLRAIRTETVRAALDSLLRAEGLPPSSTALSVIRPVDLDGDPRTEEALVDVVSGEHCDASGLCTTLVVVARCDGLSAVGHGRYLQPLDSRTQGWMDVGESARTLFSIVPVVVRALHWVGARYSL